MTFRRILLLLVLAVLATPGGMRAADAGGVNKPELATTSKNADLQKLISQFNARRDTLLADRQALLSQLKNATEEQKKAILQKMEAQQKDLIEAQRALGKQLRDEMRKLRQSSPAGPGR